MFYLNVLLYASGLVKYNPMRVSSYLPLAKELNAKHGCLNIQNNDEKCFLWSIQASLHSVQHGNHTNRVSKYQEYEHVLNMSGIQYPADIKDIVNTKTTFVLASVGAKIKKSSRYVLPP